MAKSRDNRNPKALTEQELRHIRRVVKSLRDRQGGAVPHSDLVALASGISHGSLITVDFQPSEHVDGPMVVVQLANEPERQNEFLLSPREQAVAALIAVGLANKEIAARLGIAASTVKDHVHRILTKTGLPNRAAIAVVCGNPRHR